MAKFIMRRILLGILTLFAVSVIVFVATQALPGNAAQAILGKTATPGARARARAPASSQRVGLCPVHALAGRHPHRQPRDLGGHPGAGEPTAVRTASPTRPSSSSWPRSSRSHCRSRSARGWPCKRDTAVDYVGSTVLARVRRAARVRDRHRARAPVRDLGLPRPPGGVADPARGPRLESPQRGDPARGHARAGRDPVHQPDHARLDGRGARERLRDDGAAEGPARAHRDRSPRGAERDRPGDPGLGAPARVDGGRRRPRRVRVLVPRHRRACSSMPSATATCRPSRRWR